MYVHRPYASRVMVLTHYTLSCSIVLTFERRFKRISEIFKELCPEKTQSMKIIKRDITKTNNLRKVIVLIHCTPICFIVPTYDVSNEYPKYF